MGVPLFQNSVVCLFVIVAMNIHQLLNIGLVLVLCISSRGRAAENAEEETSYWTKRRSCQETHCPQGRCHFKDCENPTSCSGGLCTFINCKRPSCDGGLCTFEACSHPKCKGGKCQFHRTATTLVHGFCEGGVCSVDNEIISSNMADQLAY